MPHQRELARATQLAVGLGNTHGFEMLQEAGTEAADEVLNGLGTRHGGLQRTLGQDLFHALHGASCERTAPPHRQLAAVQQRTGSGPVPE